MMEASDVRFESMPCPLGCAPGDERVLTGRDRLLRRAGEFEVVRCVTCGLVRTNPRPTADTIQYFYPSEYAPYQIRPNPKLTLRDHVAARAHRLMNAWRTPDLPPGRLFEFGCGPGGFLQWMAQQGWKVTGLEMSSTAAATARSLGFPVQNGTLEEARAPGEPYDLNVGWMVVEHLHQPVAALRKLAAWTVPSGWLAISVPNSASREASLFGDNWYALELPRHLYHFTPDTITALLKKAGWNVRKILHQRNVDNAIASCGFVLERKSNTPGARFLADRLIHFPTNVPMHVLTYPFLFPMAGVLAALGETGRMTIFAQKAA